MSIQYLKNNAQFDHLARCSCYPIRITSDIKRILGECLFISSFPGKASRKPIKSRGLPSYSSCVLEAEPGKLDIKRSKPIYQFISWFALQTDDSDVLVDFHVDLTSWTNAI